MIDFVLPGEAFDAEIRDPASGAVAVFHLRRLTPSEERECLDEATERGRTDARKWITLRLQRSVTGWASGSIAVNGQERGYDRDLIAVFPDWLRGELIAAVERARPTPPSRNGSPVS